MTSLPSVPEAVRELVERLERVGYETWTVGGAVRDSLRHPAGIRDDWDLATQATPSQMRRVFARTVPLGPEHGTLGVFGRDKVMYEITTFRRDVATDGRRAVVAFADTVEEDLARRDFTVNAMAWHPIRRELRDPFGGQDDLRAGVLRAVGSPSERFREDYLRVLRGLRFAGALGLEIESRTWDGLVEAVTGLGRLSQERVRDELLKALCGPEASRTLRLYRRAGVLPAVLPELGPLDGHVFAAVDATWARTPDRAALRRMGTLLVLALEAAGERGRAAQAVAFGVLQRLRFSNAHRDRLAAVAGAGSGPSADVVAGASARRRWVAEIGPERAMEAFRVWIAVRRARGGGVSGATAQEVVGVVLGARRDLREGVPTSLAGLQVGGRDLVAHGWPPGPAVGNALRRLLEAVWEDPSRNERDVLLELAGRPEGPGGRLEGSGPVGRPGAPS